MCGSLDNVSFNKTEADRSRDNCCTNVTNAVTLGPPAVLSSYVSHMASFPVPVEYKIVRNVQSVRTYVTELAQSNTPTGARVGCPTSGSNEVVVSGTKVCGICH